MEPPRLAEADLVRWAESLAGIARTGLAFTESLYERERYEEVLAVAADIRAHADDRVDPIETLDEWMRSIGKGVPGYVTPKVTVGAAVGNEHGELLLIQRRDSGFWLFPTGWADVGYSAAEVVVKEVREETGIEVEVVRLIAVLDGIRQRISRTPIYSLLFQCRPVGGELAGHPLETSDVGWFTRDALPEPLAGYDLWGDRVFAALAGSDVDVYFEPPRREPWRHVGSTDAHMRGSER
ncbi:MAG: NUDIX hydrolase N-terminal domain-containing protein [Actinobacteria bacterium]|nr:NUDIX hydrolase N-terminal domain-containing protein [Actinomycetota bacterium]